MGFFSSRIHFLLSKIKPIKHIQTVVCFLVRLGWRNPKEKGLLLVQKSTNVIFIFHHKVKCFQVYRWYIQNAILGNKTFLWILSMTSLSSPLGIHAVCCPFLLRQDFRSFPLQASRRIPFRANIVPSKLMPVANLVIVTVLPKYSCIYLHKTF